MIIGFDGRYAEDDLVGIGKYIQSLVGGVVKRGAKCIVFYTKRPKYIIPCTEVVILHSQNRYLFEQLLLPWALKKYKVNLYHATGNVGVPIFCPIPVVLTVHDIIPLEIKDYFSFSLLPIVSKLSYRLRLTSSVAKSTKIVTDSKYVMQQLVKYLPVSSQKIQTIYCGSPEILKPDKLPQNLVGQKYVLDHGGIDLRKNLDRLIEAFAEVHNRHSEIKLVITGNNPKIKQELTELCTKLHLTEVVVFTGYLEEKVLRAVIKNALLICYPTLSEGFGFPVLEAFGLGVPVITSNISAIPEVAGQAALLINPKNIGEITTAINKVLANKKLAVYMVLKGKAEYNRFSWIKCIDEYINLYNNI